MYVSFNETPGTFASPNLNLTTNNFTLNFEQLGNSSNITNATHLDDDPCSYHKHEWLEVKFYCTAVVGTSIALMGMIGNITTAMVLSRPTMRTSNNMYLTTLAIYDTCLLLTAILLYAVEYIFEWVCANFRLENCQKILCYIVQIF